MNKNERKLRDKISTQFDYIIEEALPIAEEAIRCQLNQVIKEPDKVHHAGNALIAAYLHREFANLKLSDGDIFNICFHWKVHKLWKKLCKEYNVTIYRTIISKIKS